MTFRPRILAAILLVGIGAALRVPGVFDQFWLDEIWSLRNARLIGSPFEILTRLHTDNNHPLNTLALYWIGDHEDWIIYRLPSLVAGILTLPFFLQLAASRLSPVGSLCALGLLVTSYPMVVYSSEARGYGPAIFFGVLSVRLFDRWRTGASTATRLSFQATLTAGFLSHLTFGFVALALAARAAADHSCRRAGIVRLFVPPLLIVATAYAPYFAGWQHAGGPPAGAFDALIRSLSLVAGAPKGSFLEHWGAALVAGLFLVELYRLWRDGDPEWVFFAALLALSIVCSALAPVSSSVVVRYFIVFFPFLVLLTVSALERLLTATRLRLPLLLAIGSLLAAANLVQIHTFLRIGRGHYLEAMRLMAGWNDDRLVSLTSDQDFGNRLVIEFYERYFPETSFRYVPLTDAIANPPEWLVLQAFGPNPSPSLRVVVGSGLYRLVFHAPYFGELSGFHWLVYRRIGPR